jgi:hypothetical protein
MPCRAEINKKGARVKLLLTLGLVLVFHLAQQMDNLSTMAQFLLLAEILLLLLLVALMLGL